MKKKVLFLLPLFLGACSDSGESPVITIEKLYVKVDQGDGETIREDYANRMSEMPALKVGDKVDAFLILDGNGAELKSFQLQNGEEMKTELRYEKTEVTTDDVNHRLSGNQTQSRHRGCQQTMSDRHGRDRKNHQHRL